MTDPSPVYRAPMRSRDDTVDPVEAVEWALLQGVVGVGGRLQMTPSSIEDAAALVADADERVAARLDRFAAAPASSFVWTRVPGRDTWLGRMTAPWRFDASQEARRLDLQHVRACEWLDQPVPDSMVPAGVRQTFARGGRNFQRIRTSGVEAATGQVWAEVSGY